MIARGRIHTSSRMSAGNRIKPPVIVAVSISPVHPRACGERRVTAGSCPLKIGSSPRMRGTLLFIGFVESQVRFIPAHAGNALPCPSVPILDPVHPRACGERGNVITRSHVTSGSSPRMRGTPLAASSSSRLASVHPRACGERILVNNIDRDITGSSPRMRGTPHVCRQGKLATRFIPAHAGNARHQQSHHYWKSVHPRACGERVKALTGQRVGCRFIPAHAGNAK